MTKSALDSTEFDIENARRSIDNFLEQATQFSDDCPDRLKQAIRYSLLSPGKRLRPLLVLMATEACGSQVEQALPAAALSVPVCREEQEWTDKAIRPTENTLDG